MSDVREKLKPCPFCGGGAEISMDGHCDVSYSVTGVTIECSECDCEMYLVDNAAVLSEALSEALVEKAIVAWNARAYESEITALQEENERLKAEIEKIKERAKSAFIEYKDLIYNPAAEHYRIEHFMKALQERDDEH